MRILLRAPLTILLEVMREAVFQEVAHVAETIFAEAGRSVLPASVFFSHFYPLVAAAQARPDRKAAVVQALERLQAIGLLDVDPVGSVVHFRGWDWVAELERSGVSSDPDRNPFWRFEGYQSSGSHSSRRGG